MTLITVRSALEVILPDLIDVIGEQQVRAVFRRTQELMGEGGTVSQWLMAMAVAVTELDNRDAETALLAAVKKL